MKKRFLALFLCVIMVIGVSPVNFDVSVFADDVTSGECGNNLIWSFDTVSHILTISGTGVMFNYSEQTTYTTTPAPWKEFCSNINIVIINDGVASIGDFSFYNCTSLKSMTIPESVTNIGNSAFEGCTSLTSVTIPDSVTDIGDSAFYGCTGLENVSIGNSVTSIGYYAFYGCKGLKELYINANNLSDFTNSNPCVFSYAGSSSNELMVTFGNNVTKIPARLFYENSFSTSPKIKSITISSSVRSVGYCAFTNNSTLNDIYYYGTEENWDNTLIGDGNTRLNKATMHYYLEVPEQPATCTQQGMSAYSYWSNTEPVEYIVEPVVIPISHSFTNYVSDNNATCLMDGTKTAKCDNCDKTDTIADEGSALGHALIHHTGKASTCKEKGYADYDTCSRCDYTTYSELPLADHTPAAAVTENEVKATCTENGSYDSVVYCSVCGEELSREKQIEKALGHNIIHHTGKPSTCKEKGYADYDTCSRCDYTTYSELPLAEHIPATAVKENTVAATCTENGSYDSVVYCSVCGEELNRDTVNVPMTDHSPTTIIKENISAATCTENGSYDSVVYCSVCGDELSRKTETTAKTGHKDKNNDGVCDICGTVTDTAKHNAYLLGKAKINVKSSATVDYRSTVTVTATASGLPEGYMLAVYEGSSLKAKGSATSVSYNAGELMGNKTFTVKVVNSGNTPQKDSSGKEVSKTVEVKVKSGFFDKLIAFFRNLFGSLPKVEIKP